jgi:hypothetical protein
MTAPAGIPAPRRGADAGDANDAAVERENPAKIPEIDPLPGGEYLGPRLAAQGTEETS